jgi:hypothetical protein
MSGEEKDLTATEFIKYGTAKVIIVGEDTCHMATATRYMSRKDFKDLLIIEPPADSSPPPAVSMMPIPEPLPWPCKGGAVDQPAEQPANVSHGLVRLAVCDPANPLECTEITCPHAEMHMAPMEVEVCRGMIGYGLCREPDRS